MAVGGRTLPGVWKDLSALFAPSWHTEALNTSLLIDWMHKGHTSQRFPIPPPPCSLLTYKGAPVADMFAAGMTSEVNSFGPLIRAKPLLVINSVWKGGSDGWGWGRDLEARPMALSQRLGWERCQFQRSWESLLLMFFCRLLVSSQTFSGSPCLWKKTVLFGLTFESRDSVSLFTLSTFIGLSQAQQPALFANTFPTQCAALPQPYSASPEVSPSPPCSPSPD